MRLDPLTKCSRTPLIVDYYHRVSDTRQSMTHQHAMPCRNGSLCLALVRNYIFTRSDDLLLLGIDMLTTSVNNGALAVHNSGCHAIPIA